MLPLTLRHKLVLGLVTAMATHAGIAAEKRELLFEDDFEGRDQVGENYYIGSNYDPAEAFPIVDGYLNSRQVSSDHGSTIRKLIDFKDIDIEIDFRFQGGTRFNFVLDDDHEKSVHAAHIARVSVSQKSLVVQDDKTGVMNLEVRKMRKGPTLSEKEKKTLEKELEGKKSSAKLNLKKGKWYQLRILLKGDKLEAFIDGKSVASLESPGIDHETKNKFGMTVNGDAIDFDNLKAFRVEAK